MAALSTIIAGIGVAAGLAGTAVSVGAANAASQASIRAENLREKQMNLELARQKRQAIRAGIRARSQAASNANNQGASSGSGLQGGFGQIAQGTGENMVGIGQAGQIGSGIFQANRDSASAQSLVSFGGGLSSLGGSLIDNASTIGRIGTFASGGKIR